MCIAASAAAASDATAGWVAVASDGAADACSGATLPVMVGTLGELSAAVVLLLDAVDDGTGAWMTLLCSEVANGTLPVEV